MTPLLLQGQGYTVRAPVSTAAVPAQVSHDPTDDGDGAPRPCVLVLARSTDVEMTELAAAPTARGVRVARIDADRCLDLSLTVYPAAVRVRAVPVDPALGGTLRTLARHWLLDVAAFDLLVRDGTPVFLAAGAHGDWRWCEHLSGEPAVSAGVADWVAARFEELHRAATRTGAPRG